MMYFVYVLWVSLFASSNGQPVQKRLQHVESRLSNVEVRLNYGLDDLQILQESVQALNITVLEMSEKDVLHPFERRGESSTAFKFKMVSDTDEEPFTVLKDRIFQGLSEEKTWIRHEMSDLKKRFEETTDDFSALEEQFKDTCQSIDVKLDVAENRIKQLVTNEIGKLDDVLRGAIGIVNTEIEVIKSKTEQNRRILEFLSTNLDDVKKTDDQYAAQLRNMESEFDAKVKQMQSALERSLPCSPSWRHFQGYCYLLHKEKINFDAAIKMCAAEDGIVADIHSEDENTFIGKLSGRRIWIGMTDREEEGRWLSLRNGKTPTYMNWGPNQPQNWAAYDEDCAIMDQDAEHKWHDYKCDKHTFAFICKKLIDYPSA